MPHASVAVQRRVIKYGDGQVPCVVSDGATRGLGSQLSVAVAAPAAVGSVRPQSISSTDPTRAQEGKGSSVCIVWIARQGRVPQLCVTSGGDNWNCGGVVSSNKTVRVPHGYLGRAILRRRRRRISEIRTVHSSDSSSHAGSVPLMSGGGQCYSDCFQLSWRGGGSLRV